MKLNSMKVNSAAIEDGGWIGGRAKGQTPIPGWGDLRLKVRGQTSTVLRAFQTRQAEALSPDDREPDGRPTAAASEAMLVNALVECVLLDWEGLQNDDESPLVFSKEVAREILANRDHQKFRDVVMWASSQIGEIKADQARKAAKN